MMRWIHTKKGKFGMLVAWRHCRKASKFGKEQEKPRSFQVAPVPTALSMHPIALCDLDPALHVFFKYFYSLISSLTQSNKHMSYQS